MQDRHLLHEFMTSQKAAAPKGERYIRWAIYVIVVFNLVLLGSHLSDAANRKRSRAPLARSLCLQSFVPQSLALKALSFKIFPFAGGDASRLSLSRSAHNRSMRLSIRASKASAGSELIPAR